MNEWVHIGLDVALVVSSLALAIYSFKLLNKFFKGGKFESSIKAILVAGLLFAGGSVIDISMYASEFESFNFHIFHVILNIVGVIAILYGVRQMYMAWTKLGMW